MPSAYLIVLYNEIGDPRGLDQYAALARPRDRRRVGRSSRDKSAHTPVPLSEIEEALLVGAGAGFSGLALWDLPTPATYRDRSGRTFPTTRPGGHTALFFTNDEGLYVLDANVPASKLREI